MLNWRRKNSPDITELYLGSSLGITGRQGQCHKPCPSAQSAPVCKISSALLQCRLEPQGKTHPGHSMPSPDPQSQEVSLMNLIRAWVTHFALSYLWLLRSPRCYPERQFQRRSKDENVSSRSSFLSSSVALP